MNYTELVQSKTLKAYLKNTEEAIKAIGTADMDFKINNFLKKAPYSSKEEIEEKIRTDKIFAACFAKDPLKQNIGENVLKEYLDVEFLPQSGKDAIRFSSAGNIISKKELGCSKAVDFQINSYYITQKYTGENTGGAQDNQYDDVIKFLTLGSIFYKVAACVDGWYWEENGKRAELKNYFKDNNSVIICSADDIKNKVIEFD